MVRLGASPRLCAAHVLTRLLACARLLSSKAVDTDVRDSSKSVTDEDAADMRTAARGAPPLAVPNMYTVTVAGVHGLICISESRSGGEGQATGCFLSVGCGAREADRRPDVSRG